MDKLTEVSANLEGFALALVDFFKEIVIFLNNFFGAGIEIK